MTPTLKAQPLTNGTSVLKLTSDYHPSMAPKAKAIGGRWHTETKSWRFDPRDEQRVRDLCLSVYGIDPFEPPTELVTVHLPLRAGLEKDETGTYVSGNASGGELWAFGREIAQRPGRDSSVRLGDGVIVFSGGFPSRGGSVKNPSLQPESGTILEVRDVPRRLAEAEPLAEIVAETAAPAGRPVGPAVNGTGADAPAVAAVVEAFRLLNATQQARCLALLADELPAAQ